MFIYQKFKIFKMKKLITSLSIFVLCIVYISSNAQTSPPIIVHHAVLDNPYTPNSVYVQIQLSEVRPEAYYCCFIIKKYVRIPISRVPGQPMVWVWRWVYCTYVINVPPYSGFIVDTFYPNEPGEIFDKNDYQVTGPYLSY
jgi:hypothetical protein